MGEMNLVNEIKRLKEEKNAVILAHYYQHPEVQDVADYLGDSLALSRIAASTDKDVIVFCGVHFMAETAKILAPNKKVLLPVKEAGCPMAEMVTAKRLNKYKAENPDVKIVCYVNSTAEVKALSDVCVTSSNAEKVISQLKGEKLMYVPDKNLGIYLREKYNLDMEVWKGFCCIHNDVREDEVLKAKELYPNAEFIAHPECQLNIVKMADFVGSTKQLIEYTKNSDCEEFIVGTERGVMHRMQQLSPNKQFHIVTENLSCYDMKLTHLVDVYNALKYDQTEINVEEETRTKALNALETMFKYTDQ